MAKNTTPNWIDEAFPNTSQHFIAGGIYYGYPKCCIEEFVKYPPSERTTAQNAYSVHQGKGFIPCAKHAMLILKEEITLESLITNRQCPTAFPIGDYD